MSLFLLVVFHDPQTQSSEIGKLIKFYLWCPMNEFIKTIIQMYTLENQHYIYMCEIKFKQVFNYRGNLHWMCYQSVWVLNASRWLHYYFCKKCVFFLPTDPLLIGKISDKTANKK